MVNGKKVNIPSYRVKEGDVVEVKGKEGTIKKLREMRQELKDRAVPKWLAEEKDALKGTVKSLPQKEDLDFSIQEQYS